MNDVTTSRPVVTIAVDGPSASGKSTISRMLARHLGFHYVDSGAMYRAVTWKALADGIDVNDKSAVLCLLRRMKIEFEFVGGEARMRVDGVDPGNVIREPRVADHVSIIAAIPEVRQVLVSHQRSLRESGSLVMEGRDIGSVVFPETPFKFYVDANPQLRAERRAREYGSMKISTNTEGVAKALKRRDQLDSSRQVAPLQVAPGAIVVDNSGPLEDTVNAILGHIERIRGGGTGAKLNRP